MQLDDWVLCRIYEKSTHAQRAGKEHENSCVEEVLASLPEIDDPRLMLPRLNSVAGTESAQQQALVDSMLTETTSENGCLSASIDSLHRGMMSHNNNVSAQENLQTASTLTNEWKLQQSQVDSTRNHNVRYNTIELAPASSAQRHQTLMRPNLVDMAGQFHHHHPPRMGYGPRIVEKPMPAAGRSASDEEVQSTFRSSAMRFPSNEGSLESMFPAFEHQAQSSLSYARPGTEPPVPPAMATRINFHYNHGPPGHFT